MAASTFPLPMRPFPTGCSIFQSTPHAAIDFRAALSLVVKDLRLFSYSAENRNSSLAINIVQGHA